MDIVVRTPHGDADVSIVSHAPTTTLGDVVAAVTGQAVPRIVLVDGDTVDARAVLDDVELMVGSVVTSEPSMPTTSSDADVDLVQVAGHGAGRIMRLGPGRYRVGPGRRSNADELEVAPVERTIFDLVVEPTSSASEVTVVPTGSPVTGSPVTGSPVTGSKVARSAVTGSAVTASDETRSDARMSDLTIDGAHVVVARPWRDGTLTVGARAFQIRSPAHSRRQRAHSVPDHDGTLAFSRPPRRSVVRERRPVVDALCDATVGAPALWNRRPGHPDAFVVPIGVSVGVGTATTVTVDLGANRAVAVTGSERFRGALARSLVIEAVTLHGPADLDLVVLSDPDRVGDWDWAKWLPHLRRGGRVDGPPAIWSSRHDISRWSDASHGHTPPHLIPSHLIPSHLTPSHLTLVILDDPGLWNRRDAPARSIMANPPDHLRLIALCDDGSQAPAICTTMICETDDDLGLLHSFARADDDEEKEEVFRPALTEPGVAVRVALALAPLADVDLAPQATPPADDEDRFALSELVGAAGVDQVLARWATADPCPTAAIGRRGQEFVDVPVAADVTVVVGSSMGDAFDVAATSLVAQCVERSPADLWIAPIVVGHSPRSELLWRLPHATDRHDVDSAIEPRRLLARLRAVLADPAGPARIVVVSEAPSGAATTPGETWLTTLSAGARDISGLSMVVVTDRPETADLLGDTVIRVERRYDEPGTARRVALLATADGGADQPFTPLQPTASATTELELRPFVVGRSLTPLERRIEQRRAQTSNAPNPAFDTVIAVLRDAASRPRPDSSTTIGWTNERAVVPAPMPTRVDVDDLFADSPGDGVPIGLADDPDHAGVRTRWWEPGSGSMLVFGSRRSGMEQVITTILLGAIDRFSVFDVRLVIIEPSPARRRAFGDLDHPRRVVDPDRPDDLVGLLDEVAAELDRHAAPNGSAEHHGPRMVVLIRDLVHLRRRYAEQPIGVRIDEVVTRAAAADSGVDIVAAAADLEGAGPFAASAARRLVGASSDHRELAALGVDHPIDVDGIVGRCRSFPDGDLVQLATTDATIETLLARRSTGGTA